MASLKLNMNKKEMEKGKENDQIAGASAMEWKKGFLLGEPIIF
jgi:hypothetical protein